MKKFDAFAPCLRRTYFEDSLFGKSESGNIFYNARKKIQETIRLTGTRKFMNFWNL